MATIEATPQALSVAAAEERATRLAIEYGKAQRLGTKPSPGPSRAAFKHSLTEFVGADLLVGCRGGRAIALPVRGTGECSPTDQILTIVVFTDHEAAQAYFARRRIGPDGFQLAALSELTGAKPSAKTWAKLYVASRAYNAVLNPCGPYSKTVSREHLLLVQTAGKPLFKLGKAESAAGAPRFMDIDERNEFRARWARSCGEMDQLLSAGKFGLMAVRLSQLDYHGEFMGTCQVDDLRRITGVRDFATGHDKRGVLEFLKAAISAADSGFPEDAIDRYLILGGKLRQLLAGGELDPDFVSQAAVGVAASLEVMLATWDAASVDPYRTAEAQRMAAELRTVTDSVPGQRPTARDSADDAD